MLRTFSVFHATQIDGIPGLVPPVATKTVPERIEDVEIIVKASGVPVRIGGDRAFYSPALDLIQMPPDEAFHSPEVRATTLFHELAHASGHASRLNRDLSGKFGSALYAKEEIRAEWASCAVGSILGIPCDIPNHANYLQSWLKRSEAGPPRNLPRRGRGATDRRLHPRLPSRPRDAAERTRRRRGRGEAQPAPRRLTSPSPHPALVEINGPIGLMRHNLRAWLLDERRRAQ